MRKMLIMRESAYYEKWRLSQNTGYLIFPKSSSSPNKQILVRAKRVCLLSEKCLL